MPAIEWDTHLSTYWWKFNLDKQHPANQRPGKAPLEYMIGYSKAQNQAEAVDKITCFCSKVSMFQKNGWFDKTVSIEFYERVGAYTSVQDDNKLFVFYPFDFKVNPAFVGKIDTRIKQFLTNLYEIRKTGKQIENLRPLPTKINKDDIYIYTAGKFKTAQDLYNWCEKKISEGENRQRVLSYYREYFLRNFSHLDKLTNQK